MVGIRSPDGLVVEEEEEEEDLFVFNDTIEGPRAPAVKPGRSFHTLAFSPAFTSVCVCGGQPSPHKPRLVVSYSACPPLSSSPTRTALY